MATGDCETDRVNQTVAVHQGKISEVPSTRTQQNKPDHKKRDKKENRKEKKEEKKKTKQTKDRCSEGCDVQDRNGKEGDLKGAPASVGLPKQLS